MPRRILPRVVTALLLVGFALSVPGQEDTVPRPVDSAPVDTAVAGPAGPNLYMGTTTHCQLCHAHEWGKAPEAFRQAVGRVRFDERRIWSHDPHSNAYRSLESERGQSMLARLNEMRAQSEREPLPSLTHLDAGCIQCHSISAKRDGFFQGVDIDAVRKEGVSCESCHGPASNWILPHAIIEPRWLSTTPSAVKEKFGLRDLHNSERRAHACLSCHLGDPTPKDPGQKKLLTHEMYMAGHPPLSGFEIETAVDRLPRHWSYPYESHTERIPEKVVAQASHGEKIVPYLRTRHVLTSNLLAMRRSALLMDVRAWRTTAAPAPEFSRFDCFACHHELGDADTRQRRGYVGVPGRPTVRYWSLPLALATVEMLGGESNELVQHLTDLHQDFKRNVFGAEGGNPQTGAFVEWCDEQIARLREVKLNDANVGELFSILGQQNDTGLMAARGMDFDSARQFVGALWIVYHDRAMFDKTFQEGRSRESLQALRLDVGLDSQLYEHARDYQLVLVDFLKDSGGDGYDEPTYTSGLERRLDQRAEYSAKEFARKMAAFVQSLP